MSKNILKQSQEGRTDAQGSGEESSESDALRKAMMKRELTGDGEEKRLNAQIPAGLHERFKQACQTEGKSMTTVLVGLLETWLQLRE